ncbi:MAG: hypothetical protein SH850_05545 [Planctomycetaceae bacterium]|nr:hypothetical protein [Planctomycetaceae bacterium]
MLLLVWHLLLLGRLTISADEPSVATPTPPAPIMLDITDRDPPSAEEWKSLHLEINRGLLGDGGLGDFSSKYIRVNGTRYWTTNATEGTLASYGKKITDNPQHYDRMGHIKGVEYSVDGNSWKGKYVVNSDALLKLTGNRFREYAGVSADVASAGAKQIEITFLVVDVPKEQIIRQLNADSEALEYFGGLLARLQQHRNSRLKKVLEKEPPTPQVVVGNVIVLSGEFSKSWDLAANGAIRNVVTATGVKLEINGRMNETITCVSPVVRCYRMYSVDFKIDDQGRPISVEVLDPQGRKKIVPQVFDLTPEI